MVQLILACLVTLLLGSGFSEAGTLDIVVVSDSFTDQVEFEAKAEKSRVLLASLEPFKSRPADWTWRTVFQTTPLDCKSSWSRLLTCNRTLAKAAAGPHDKVLVLSKGFGNKGSGGDVAVCSTGTYGYRVCIHEFAHSLGNLLDEYTLYSSPGVSQDRFFHNCWLGANPPDTRLWKKGCQHPNWWRLEPCTLMKRVDSAACAYFGERSVADLAAALDYWKGQP